MGYRDIWLGFYKVGFFFSSHRRSQGWNGIYTMSITEWLYVSMVTFTLNQPLPRMDYQV